MLSLLMFNLLKLPPSGSLQDKLLTFVIAFFIISPTWALWKYIKGLKKENKVESKQNLYIVIFFLIVSVLGFFILSLIY